MTDDDSREHLLNPYRIAPGEPAVRGITLGRVGLAAVGVLVVAAAPGRLSVNPETEVWIGGSPAVEQEVSAHSMPAGYLWPSPPPAGLEASPALR